MNLEDALCLGASGAMIGILSWPLWRALGRFALARAPAPGRQALRRRLVLGFGAWLGLLGVSAGSCEWLPGPQPPADKPRPRILHCYHRSLRDLRDGPRRDLERDSDNRRRLLHPPAGDRARPAQPARGERPGPHCWLHPRVLEKARAQLAAAEARARSEEPA